ncbi:MAG: Maf family protein [Anaerolineae bacterium]|jgi:septum formation protein|nr:septum formation protein Maf [Chloroflexota bacterium]
MPHSVPAVILASQSPRRRELLSDLELPFTVDAPTGSETGRLGEAPEALAVRLAAAKAQEVSARAPGALIIAADTLVVLEGRVLGKPHSAEEAVEMLMRLRGRRHHVYTGLALMYGGRGLSASLLATTPVQMRTYSDMAMRAYVATGEPMDKAGAYAVQSEVFDPVQRVENCWANVVGLPLCHLYRSLVDWELAPPRHPLERCPWAVRHGGCSWAGAILNNRVP